MKRIILIIAIALCNTLQAKENFKLLSFNIWDPNDISFWEKVGGFPVKSIFNYVCEDYADILLLQEVSLENGQSNQVYHQLKNLLKEKGYKYTAYYRSKKGVGYYDGMQNSGYPLAILSKFPIIETYATQKSGDTQMSKGVLGVKILFNNKPLFIFNTHLGIGSPGTDNEIKNVALPYINNITGNHAVLFGGDFNSPPAADFPNSEKKIGNYTYSSMTTQPILDSGFEDCYFKANKIRDKHRDATCPAQDDYIKRVDHVYCRNWGLKAVKAFVKENPWEYCNKVDHRGVVVVFQSED